MMRKETCRHDLKWTMLFIAILGTQMYAAAQKKSERPSPPAHISETIHGDTRVTIDYSQPAVKGRTIWGGLVPYHEVWRTGANEATWIGLSKDVKIGTDTLPKGKYSIFTIPGEDQWTVIFNKTWKQWGAFEYDPAKDVLRITVTPHKADQFHELFTISVSPEGKVRLDWEKLTVNFDLQELEVN